MKIVWRLRRGAERAGGSNCGSASGGRESCLLLSQWLVGSLPQVVRTVPLQGEGLPRAAWEHLGEGRFRSVPTYAGRWGAMLVAPTTLVGWTTRVWVGDQGLVSLVGCRWWAVPEVLNP